jgi:hypothetical protein
MVVRALVFLVLFILAAGFVCFTTCVIWQGLKAILSKCVSSSKPTSDNRKLLNESKENEDGTNPR